MRNNNIDWTNRSSIASIIQHTNVKPELTREEAVRHIEECAENAFDAAMISPCWIGLAKSILSGTEVKIATTVNFPQATDTPEMKAEVVPLLAQEGADEFDFPPNPGFLLSGLEKEYFSEIKKVVDVAHAEGLQVKAMLEFGYLETYELKRKATELAVKAGVDWVKQSSGWGKGGIAATEEDVRLLKETVSSNCGVKASGKINSMERLKEMAFAGAGLIGTSSGVKILAGLKGEEDAY